MLALLAFAIVVFLKVGGEDERGVTLEKRKKRDQIQGGAQGARTNSVHIVTRGDEKRPDGYRPFDDHFRT